jgi:hypothetical protein
LLSADPTRPVVPFIDRGETAHQPDRHTFRLLDSLNQRLLVVSITQVPLAVNGFTPEYRLFVGHVGWKRGELLFRAVRKPNEIFPEDIILPKDRPVVHGDVRVIVVPALERIPSVEHSFPVMITWDDKSVNWSHLAGHIDQLYEKPSTLPKRLLPASVLYLPGTNYGRFSDSVDIEKIIAKWEQDFLDKEMRNITQDLSKSSSRHVPGDLDVIVLARLFVPGQFAEMRVRHVDLIEKATIRDWVAHLLVTGCEAFGVFDE